MSANKAKKVVFALNTSSNSVLSVRSAKTKTSYASEIKKARDRTRMNGAKTLRGAKYNPVRMELIDTFLQIEHFLRPTAASSGGG